MFMAIWVMIFRISSGPGLLSKLLREGKGKEGKGREWKGGEE